MNLLVMNAGSSSQKCALYHTGEAGLPDTPPEPMWEGKIEWSAPGGALMTVQSNGSSEQAKHEVLPDDISHQEGLRRLLGTLWSGTQAVLSGPQEVTMVGHRVVHGGSDFQKPTRVSLEVKAVIERLTPLAPAHNPAALDGMKVIEQLLGANLHQVAVFDTAFHCTIPDAAAVYPGPYSWVEQGIRRYGFHGINHAWCVQRAARMLVNHDPTALRLICCHLGNGCSLSAVRGGICLDTTMGFTPMEGLMMGSRSGSIDPGILLYLLGQSDSVSVAELGRILNEESGLKGLSGVSEDMRGIMLAIKEGDKRAQLALDVYIHRLRSGIGAMIASLGGLDALVFTAGVGENSAAVRSAACAPFAFLNLLLDDKKNNAAPEATSYAERDISQPESQIRILVIPAQEDWAVARECWLLASGTNT